jgi:cytochrome c556
MPVFSIFHKISTPVIGLSLLVSSSGIALAEESSAIEKAVEYRQGVMNVLSWNTKAIGDMLKGKTQYDAEQVKTHAKDIASTASLDILPGFPEDSESEDSAAMTEIWMDFDDFEQKMADFRQAASDINVAAQSGDQGKVDNAMKNLGKSCKGCHKKYKN